MEITRKRIRIDYAPLNVAVSLVCVSSGSPLTQVYTAKTNSYEPNRTLTPTVVKPVVEVNASDGSLDTPYGNSMLANMVWYIDGVDISTLDEWSGLYEIATDGSNRGTITLYKNVEVGKQYNLSFYGEIADNRLGVNVPIQTDCLVLSTTDSSETGYSLAISEDTLIRYNPFNDALYAYEYKVAHGKITADASVQAAATDTNAYLRTIPITLYRGEEEITTDYTIKVFEIAEDGTETEITADDTNEFNEIDPTFITMDLRMVEKADYMIRAYVEEEEVASLQYSVSRIFPTYRVRSTNGTSISLKDTTRYDKAMVDSDGSIVENAENLIIMVWFTTTAYKTAVQHNEGGSTLYTLESTGIGKNYDDDWLDQYIETEHKGIHQVAIDDEDDELTDEDENQYIIN